MEKIRNEIKKVVIEPYLAKNPSSNKNDISLEKIIDYDSIEELNFFTTCFLESLRIEPAVASSSICVVTEATQLGKYKIMKNQTISIEMLYL